VCYALYMSSSLPLPLAAWDAAAPGFNVQTVQARERRVARQFSFDHLYYVGSRKGCGCGYAKEAEAGDVARQAQADYDGLAAYLRDGLKRGAEIELFFCWEGEEEELPESRQVLLPGDLERPDFRFTEKCFVQVRPG